MLGKIAQLAGFAIGVVILWQSGALAYAYEAIYNVMIEVLLPFDAMLGGTG